jgi:uncharacterized protein (DUF2141 family)
MPTIEDGKDIRYARRYVLTQRVGRINWGTQKAGNAQMPRKDHSVKRVYVVCLFPFLVTIFLLSQSSPVLQIKQGARVAAPTSNYSPRSEGFRATARKTPTTQTQGPSFAPAVTYGSGGYYASSVVVADVNGDGKPDLVVANECASSCSGSSPEDGAVGVLLGNGDGTFQTAVLYDSGGYFGHSVAVADVNGDGKPDLLVTIQCSGIPCSSDSRIGVLLGNGDGTFQTAVTYGSGGYAAESVAVRDVNGDGKLDLVVANQCIGYGNCANGGSVGVLLGNGDGTFQTAVLYDSGGTAESVAVADVNGDGKPDLVVANYCASGCPNGTNSNVGMLLGNGDGTFQPIVTIYSGGYASPSVVVGDVNGDGKPDLVVSIQCTSGNMSSGCTNPEGIVSVLLGNGDGTFQAAVTYDSGGVYAYSVAVADVNGDGKPDLVAANGCANSNCSSDGTVSVLLGNGDGTFQAAMTYDSGGWEPLSVAVADVNRDGKPDVVVANDWVSTNNLSGLVGVLLNTSISATTTTALSSSQNPSALGQSVAFTATVATSGSVIPTGMVTFMDGSTTLGTGTLNSFGIAIYTTSNLVLGQHSMTAVYGGDVNNAGGTSSVLTQTVSAADFSITSNPTSTTVTAGQSGTFTLTVTPQGSFTGSISFSCTGLPVLAGCGFSPAMVTPNTSTMTTTLTITTAAHTAAHATALAPPPFGRRPSPLYAIWLLLPAMLLGMVGLAVPKRRKLLSCVLVGLLAGGCLLQAACGGASTGGGGGGGTGGTPAGTYTVTVTGAAGSTQHATAVTLTVQ